MTQKEPKWRKRRLKLTQNDQNQTQMIQNDQNQAKKRLKLTQVNYDWIKLA